MGGGGSGLSRLDRGASNVRLDAAIRNGPGSVRVVAVLVDDYSSHVQLDSVATGLCFRRVRLGAGAVPRPCWHGTQCHVQVWRGSSHSTWPQCKFKLTAALRVGAGLAHIVLAVDCGFHVGSVQVLLPVRGGR
jgi:hypothetical protein